MSSLYCRLCFLKSNEYYTINSDFRSRILKHLDLQVSANTLICKNCTEHVDTFEQFYNEIHKSQLKFKEQKAQDQKDELRFIIVLKDSAAEIRLDEAENTTSAEHQITLIDIPKEVTPVEDEAEMENSEREEETSAQSDEGDSSSELQPSTATIPMNLEDFPKEIISDSKLTVKGKELSKLIAKFYKLECNLCSMKKKFRKFSAMVNHFKNVHSTKGFVNCCGMKISKVRQIALHMAFHIQPEAFQCPSCRKHLTCPKILQYHIQNHLPESERKFPCPEPGCSRRFSYQSALVTHSISHLPESDRTSFGCDKCGRKFSTAGRLSAHLNTVHSKSIVRREFTCKICSKNFLCKSNLAYHLTTHKNFEFQVECGICKKWLKNKICLRKHMTIHSEVKHSCDLCDYSAANKQCLMNHRKVQHSDLKPFSCEVCLKTFKLKNTLINHVNAQHNGLKKYSCEFCTKTFVSSGNYYSHRKRMHPRELSQKNQEKEIDNRRQRQEFQKRQLSGK